MPDTGLTDNVSVYTSAFHDANVRQQVVTTCTSATRPTGVEGRMIAETDTNGFQVHTGSAWVPFGLWGTWTAWTPRIDQGASTNIAKTVTYSRYVRIGSLVTWTFNILMTASGTAGSALVLTLPVTAVSGAGGGGAGMVYDFSTTTRYSAHIEFATPTTAIFVGDWSGASGWGAVPNLAIASGDVLRGTVTYEAA